MRSGEPGPAHLRRRGPHEAVHVGILLLWVWSGGSGRGYEGSAGGRPVSCIDVHCYVGVSRRHGRCWHSPEEGRGDCYQRRALQVAAVLLGGFVVRRAGYLDDRGAVRFARVSLDGLGMSHGSRVSRSGKRVSREHLVKGAGRPGQVFLSYLATRMHVCPLRPVDSPTALTRNIIGPVGAGTRPFKKAAIGGPTVCTSAGSG